MTLEGFGRLLSLCLVKNNVFRRTLLLYMTTEMLNCFNEHFVSSGRLFDSVSSVSVQPCVDEPVRVGQTFCFLPFFSAGGT